MTPKRLISSAGALAIAGGVALVFAVSGGSAKTAAKSSSATATATIAVKQGSLGTPTLVDGQGRTLYLFEADGPNVSRLSAAGARVWPPFTTTSKPLARGGALAGDIGTTTTVSGQTQVTYNGHPLYYFLGDKAPGDVNGQGLNEFGALWYGLRSQGTAITKAASTSASPSSPAAPSSPVGGSYAY